MQRILVTGAAGKCGYEVCRALARAGCQVHATDILPGDHLRVPFVQGDLAEEAFCRELIEGCDGVVHLANVYESIGFPESKYRESMLIHENLLAAVENSPVNNVIFTSTIQVYKGMDRDCATYAWRKIDSLPQTLEAPLEATNGYARGKLQVEEALRSLAARRSISCATLRLCGILTESEIWRSKLIGRCSSGKMNMLCAYITVRDTARLIRRLVTDPLEGFTRLFPTSGDNLMGLPADELAKRFYSEIPVEGDLEGLFGLIDISHLKEICDWTPSKVANPLPLPLMRLLPR